MKNISLVNEELFKSNSKGFGVSCNHDIKVENEQEFVIDGTWSIYIPESSGKALHIGVNEFRDYMKRCHGIEMKSAMSPSLHTVVIEIDSKNDELLCLQNSNRSFIVKSSPETISICALSEAGAVNGVYYLAKLMDLRRAPILMPFEEKRNPIYERRISGDCIGAVYGETEFCLDNYPDKYLAKMSYFGITDIFFHVPLFGYCESDLIPELNNPNIEESIAKLNRFVDHISNYNLGVVLYLKVETIPEDALVFFNKPEVRGAESYLYGKGNVLCSSNALVKEFFAEIISNIFKRVPKLSGVCLIPGEGFMHCYSHSTPRFIGTTNCPNCRKHDDIDKVVADLINPIAKSVKSVSPEARIIYWAYSDRLISLDEKDEKRLISYLSKDITFMSDISKLGEEPNITGRNTLVADYSLSYIGPSERFKKHRAYTTERNIEHWVKTDISNTILCWNSAYCPSMQRWIERFKRVAESGVTGALESWRFFGFTGSVPEELADWLSWSPAPKPEELLQKIATRNFGLKNTDTIISAWKYFSEALEYAPYFIRGTYESAWLNGPAYPFAIGPNDSYDYNVESKGGRKRKWKMRPDHEKVIETKRSIETNISSLLGYMPSDTVQNTIYGHVTTKDILATLQRFISGWLKGIRYLEKTDKCISVQQKQLLDKEMGIARSFYHHARTMYLVTQFYNLRVKYAEAHMEPGIRPGVAEQMLVIAREEEQNAKEYLPFIEKDRTLGGRTADCSPEAIQAKLKHLSGVIDMLQSVVRKGKKPLLS